MLSLAAGTTDVAAFLSATVVVAAPLVVSVVVILMALPLDVWAPFT